MRIEREVKVFHLGDILSITTGVLLSPRYMDGVYELVRYLTGYEPRIDQLDEAMVACRIYLIDRHAGLEGIDTGNVDFETWRAWLDVQVQRLGEFIEVTRPLPGELGAAR